MEAFASRNDAAEAAHSSARESVLLEQPGLLSNGRRRHGVQRCAVQCNAVQYSAVQCGAVLCSAVWCNAMQCYMAMLQPAHLPGPRLGPTAVSAPCRLCSPAAHGSSAHAVDAQAAPHLHCRHPAERSES